MHAKPFGASILAVFVWLGARGGSAEDPSMGARREAAMRLVEVLRIEQAASEAAALAVQDMLRLEPAWGGHLDILADYVEERIGWEQLQPVVVKGYTDAFTEEEIREMIRFYESPVGRKMVLTAPALAMEMQVWVRKRMQEEAGVLELRMKNRELERALNESVFLDGGAGAAGGGEGAEP